PLPRSATLTLFPYTTLFRSAMVSNTEHCETDYTVRRCRQRLERGPHADRSYEVEQPRPSAPVSAPVAWIHDQDCSDPDVSRPRTPMAAVGRRASRRTVPQTL